MRKVTGIVTCYNEEANIGACIESMAWCDEILVVDSYSTDRTAEIARSYDKVRFVQRTYFGGASQKNWAIEQATHDWIFLLDSDERCTEALQQEIHTLLEHGPAEDAYWIKRRCFVLGRALRFSGWQNDSVIRLFRKGRAYYQNRRVHAGMRTTGRVSTLKEPMLHYLVVRFDEYVRKLANYGYWGAAQCWRDGRRSNFALIFSRPVWRFLRMYFLQMGFLDGTRGLAFCMVQSYATYVKWSILWSWQVEQKEGRAPQLPEFDEDQNVWSGLERITREKQEREPHAVGGL